MDADIPIIPINATGTIAPDQASILAQALQMVLKANPPTSKLPSETPDQKAAAGETDKMKGDSKKAVLPAGQTIEGKKSSDGNSSILPNIIDQLFNGKASSEVDKTSGSSKTAEQSSGGLTSALHTLRGDGEGKEGGVGKALSFLKLVL